MIKKCEVDWNVLKFIQKKNKEGSYFISLANREFIQITNFSVPCPACLCKELVFVNYLITASLLITTGTIFRKVATCTPTIQHLVGMTELSIWRLGSAGGLVLEELPIRVTNHHCCIVFLLPKLNETYHCCGFPPYGPWNLVLIHIFRGLNLSRVDSFPLNWSTKMPTFHIKILLRNALLVSP
jgi:hypothetical protein